MSSSSSSSSSSSQQDETDYHIQHFCDDYDRLINKQVLTELLTKKIGPPAGTTVDEMEHFCNLAGICNFYMKTVDEALLNYFPLEKGYFAQRCQSLYFEKSYRFRKSVMNAGEMDFVEIGPLYPIRTDGDGNCLLHAISICMWGCHDPLIPTFKPQYGSYLLHRRALFLYIGQNRDILLLHYKAAG